MRRSRQRGQAAVETAISIPIMFAMVLGFYAVEIVFDAHVELESAVTLATVSAAAAPMARPPMQIDSLAQQFARESFDETKTKPQFKLIQNAKITCIGLKFQPGGSITCTGTADVGFLKPLVDIHPDATTTAYVSPYRST